MLRLIRTIIFYAAVSVLLLHNVIPHQHHGELATALHEKEHRSTNVLDFLRTVFHEAAPQIENAKFKQIKPFGKLVKAIYQVPTKDIKLNFVGASWRQWLMMYEASLYYAELKDLCLWLNCRACWANLKPEQVNVYFSTVGFRAPPAQA